MNEGEKRECQKLKADEMMKDAPAFRTDGWMDGGWKDGWMDREEKNHFRPSAMYNRPYSRHHYRMKFEIELEPSKTKTSVDGEIPLLSPLFSTHVYFFDFRAAALDPISSIACDVMEPKHKKDACTCIYGHRGELHQNKLDVSS